MEALLGWGLTQGLGQEPKVILQPDQPEHPVGGSAFWLMCWLTGT